MNLRERIVSVLSRRRWFAWMGRWVVTPLDRALHTSPLAPSRILMTRPLCFVTTVGRHSGVARVAPLLYLTAEGGGIVVVASNWGTSSHPSWSYNLESDPKASIEIDGVVTAASARRATGVEYDTYWSRFVVMWPNYDVYRTRVHREIRMYVLEPVRPV